MQDIAFIDTEAKQTPKGEIVIESVGFLCDKKSLESSLSEVEKELSSYKFDFICGHNFIDYDKKILEGKSQIFRELFEKVQIIDTLYLSFLLKPKEARHRLKKEYKRNESERNNPVKDCQETQKLLQELDAEFDKLEPRKQEILIALLWGNPHFQGYFSYKKLQKNEKFDIFKAIQDLSNANEEFIKDSIEKGLKAELAFALIYHNSLDRDELLKSLPAALLIESKHLKGYPKITKEKIIQNLSFCYEKADIKAFSQETFKISNFREFSTPKNSQNLFTNNTLSQKDIIQSALKDESLLAILPTGGGKTFCFWLPALLKAKAYKGLTVVISPLQALMKDHIESFRKKVKDKQFKAHTLSSYLNSLEKMDAKTQIVEGNVDILYLAPESLRSISTLHILKSRFIERFVIDEAHCFSTWGHDFRSDYFFIAKFIKELEKSPHQCKIPISCFTATAKKEVLDDIKRYLKDKLEIEDLQEFIAENTRKNLHYKKAVKVERESEKFTKLIRILQEENKERKKASIIYIPQNAKECEELAKKLQEDSRLTHLGLKIGAFYAKAENKDKTLKEFLANEADIIVATTAFGMGVDKPNIECVIHYGLTDSIESYMQESGRGARDESLNANCYVLFSEKEFEVMFSRLISSRLDCSAIQELLKYLRNIAKKVGKEKIYLSVSKAQKELDFLQDIVDKDMAQSLLNIALLELEKHKFIERDFNKNTIFATSIGVKNMEEVYQILQAKQNEMQKFLKDTDRNFKEKNCAKELEKYQKYAVRIMANLIQKSKQNMSVRAEELAYFTGIEEKDIFKALNLLETLELIAKENDISVLLFKEIKAELNAFFELEKELFEIIKGKSNQIINLTELNQNLENKDTRKLKGYKTGKKNKFIKNILFSWRDLTNLKKRILSISIFNNDKVKIEKLKEEDEEIKISLAQEDLEHLKEAIEQRQKLCHLIIKKLLEKLPESKNEDDLEFSFNKLRQGLSNYQNKALDARVLVHYLVFLNDLFENFRIGKSRLIYHQTYLLTLLNKDKNYNLKDNYNKGLGKHYQNKIIALNLYRFFLEKLASDEKAALKFAKDYFSMEKDELCKEYKLNKKELTQSITKSKKEQLIKDLNALQQEIIDNNESEAILVLAGPGSGKTKTLVHKIASLLTKDSYKSENFLMLAHSRTAVSEFKERLVKLIGNTAYRIKIMTFHAFALRLLECNILNDESDDKTDNEFDKAIENACEALENKESGLDLSQIQMLVLDEFQDVSENLYRFVTLIYKNMAEDKRIIAVADDDQCINHFGNHKASVKFIEKFRDEIISSNENNKIYELTENYRSKKEIVNLANFFRKKIPNSLKTGHLIAHSKENAELTITAYKNLDFENICEKIKAELEKGVKEMAVLLRNNAEVLQMYAMLDEHKIKAQYLLERKGFSLKNLIELRDFLNLLKKYEFKEAFKKAREKYKNSTNLHFLLDIAEQFYKEYKEQLCYSKENNCNLFQSYLDEIKFDDFEKFTERVVVSTMHKAKGKEFESVFVCVNTMDLSDEYEKRLLYVAFSRAKSALHIHANSALVESIFKESEFYDSIQHIPQNESPYKPQKIIFVMGLRDIWLDFVPMKKDKNGKTFITDSESLGLIAGSEVKIYSDDKQDKISIYHDFIVGTDRDDEEIEITEPIKIASLSKEFVSKIRQKENEGYKLDKKAQIDSIVKWKKDEKSEEKLQVLCKISLTKKR